MSTSENALVRFVKALTVLAEYYEKNLSQGVIELYWQGLKQYEIEAIEGAIGRHLQNPDSGQWMPKIADIVRMIEGTSQDAAALAWAKVMRAISRVGQWESLAFDDAIIHLVIDDLGGWPKLCQTVERELPFLQKRFETSYRAYRHQGGSLHAHPRYLSGIAEMQNVAQGFTPSAPLLVGDLAMAKRVYLGGSDAPRLPVHVGVIGHSVLRLVETESAA